MHPPDGLSVNKTQEDNTKAEAEALCSFPPFSSSAVLCCAAPSASLPPLPILPNKNHNQSDFINALESSKLQK